MQCDAGQFQNVFTSFLNQSIYIKLSIHSLVFNVLMISSDSQFFSENIVNYLDKYPFDTKSLPWNSL